MYEYKISAYTTVNTYNDTSTTIVIKAKSEEDALKKCKKLITRKYYSITEIKEVNK